jgi:hypothetical protein
MESCFDCKYVRKLTSGLFCNRFYTKFIPVEKVIMAEHKCELFEKK